jgi:hypothetical protein
MIANARYAHTNLVSRDWRALARFYQDVFGCVPVPPERDYSGAGRERARACPARIRGVHLRLRATARTVQPSVFEYAVRQRVDR